MFGDLAKRLLVVGVLAIASACATRVAPPVLPSALKYPEFLYPMVPAQHNAQVATRIDFGWRLLQNDDLVSADREFALALKQSPGFYPAETGAAYVALARRDHAGALNRFGAALAVEPRYVPAIVGRGQTLLALRREDEALSMFEAALAIDGSLADLRRRVDVLRFRNLQDVIEGARASANAGDFVKARAGYAQAIEASPESPFLHRELAIVERRAGNAASALEHFRRASELDSSDASSLIQIGELLEQRADPAGAEAVYRRALAIEPNAEVSRRLDRMAAAARDATLPPQFHAIANAAQITRGDLAALVGIRLEAVLQGAPAAQVVITDTRGHWAASWISQAAGTGVIAPFENHTFQPGALVRRVDLARTVSALVRLIASRRPELVNVLSDRPTIADVDPNHLDYPAVSVAVASGMMPRLEEARFYLTNPVSGAEAIEVIERVQALAGGGR
jgi:tetratricopeptide (TPR) repeat protein